MFFSLYYKVIEQFVLPSAHVQHWFSPIIVWSISIDISIHAYEAYSTTFNQYVLENVVEKDKVIIRFDGCWFIRSKLSIANAEWHIDIKIVRNALVVNVHNRFELPLALTVCGNCWREIQQSWKWNTHLYTETAVRAAASAYQPALLCGHNPRNRMARERARESERETTINSRQPAQ